MFGTPIVVPESTEGSARGAAILAIIALGLRSTIEDFADLIITQKHVHPREEIHAYYQEQYQKFQKLLDCARSF